MHGLRRLARLPGRHPGNRHQVHLHRSDHQLRLIWQLTKAYRHISAQSLGTLKSLIYSIISLFAPIAKKSGLTALEMDQGRHIVLTNPARRTITYGPIRYTRFIMKQKWALNIQAGRKAIFA